jgi:TolB-like protein
LKVNERRLAAIMFTDMVGFTALTQSDEALSLAVLERHNRLLRPIFPKFRGREVKTIGDSFLVEFDSALDATKCAVEIQSFLHDYNVSSRDEWKITLRIGLHVGDVEHREQDVFGDAVNIASRLQPLAEPEGICVSDQIYGQVRNKVPQALVKLESRDLKGVKFAVDVYKVVMPWERHAKEAPEQERNRIAVLPFANMSPDPNDEYFADGMTEELISTLSKLGQVEVISRTSVMQFKKNPKSIKEVSKELDVGTVLEGSVRKSGSRLRVTVQMIDTTKDRHVWAESYDRELQDVFAIQTEIARQVADSLRVHFVAKAAPLTSSMDAYALYLKGRAQASLVSGETERLALEYFQQALAKDPEFALGYSALANHYIAIAGDSLAPSEAFPKARAYTTKALELDSGLADAWVARGNLSFQFEWDLQASEAAFKKAIEILQLQ